MNLFFKDRLNLKEKLQNFPLKEMGGFLQFLEININHRHFLH